MWEFIVGFVAGLGVGAGLLLAGFKQGGGGRTILSEPKPVSKREHGTRVLEYADPTRAEYDE